jgi:hypothetical protein
MEKKNFRNKALGFYTFLTLPKVKLRLDDVSLPCTQNCKHFVSLLKILFCKIVSYFILVYNAGKIQKTQVI